LKGEDRFAGTGSSDDERRSSHGQTAPGDLDEPCDAAGAFRRGASLSTR